ncbi:unnamed protein product [Closterium sp. Naga37s-1]|nr:unnamed protein product [Closterium sp. Naga37s-1]
MVNEELLLFFYRMDLNARLEVKRRERYSASRAQVRRRYGAGVVQIGRSPPAPASTLFGASFCPVSPFFSSACPLCREELQRAAYGGETGAVRCRFQLGQRVQHCKHGERAAAGGGVGEVGGRGGFGERGLRGERGRNVEVPVGHPGASEPGGTVGAAGERMSRCSGSRHGEREGGKGGVVGKVGGEVRGGVQAHLSLEQRVQQFRQRGEKEGGRGVLEGGGVCVYPAAGSGILNLYGRGGGRGSRVLQLATELASYNAVVVGVDPVCCESAEWMAAADVAGLPRGPCQPFYQVLLDSAAGGSFPVAYGE